MFELFGIAFVIMLGWGVGDFIIAALSKKLNLYRVNFWVGIFVFMMWAVAYFAFFFPRTVPLAYWWLIAVYGALSICSSLFFLKAMQVGKISLVSPISSSYGILAMALGLLFLNESLKNTQFLGIFIASIGLVLSMLNLQQLRRLKFESEVKGLRYALGALVLWGILFTVNAKIVRTIDWVTPFFFGGLIILPVSFFIMRHKREGKKGEFSIPDKRQIPLFVLSAVLIQGAFFLYLHSLNSFPSALLAPISAGYPAVTILLAHYFFKERMEKVQYIGVALILLGLVVAAI